MAESVNFDRIADRYDETRGGEERGERSADLLEPMLDSGRPVLEIGIGTGLVAAALQRRGFSVWGVDLSHAMIARARRRVGPRVAIADARRLPLRDGSVHQAFASWVLHVTGDIPGVLSEVSRVLGPGGRIIVIPSRAPRPVDPVGELERKLDRDGTRDDSEERLRAAGEPVGLRIVDSRLISRPERAVPAEEADKLETRAYSFLWKTTDEQWTEHVAPVVALLRGLPDPERPIEIEWIDQVVVMERA